MRITIHRGAHEIGGSCVELEHDGRRIILDAGMPLFNPKDKKKGLDKSLVDRKTVPELLASGILPSIPGLWAGGPAGPAVDAVLLSHPHQDHYGLLRYLAPGIPVYMSEGCRRVLEVSDIFLPTKALIRDSRLLHHRALAKVGAFRVTPYAADHSAFGAMSFLIEAGRRRIFYTGDIRGHGRKAGLFEGLLKRPPRGVDALLMEGTTLGRSERRCETEASVEAKITALGRKWKGLKLIYASAQNIDRLVSFYKAARAIDGVLAVDLYTAYLLDAIETGSVPHASREFPALRVFYTHFVMKKLLQQGMGHVLKKFQPYEIGAGEIRADSGRVFLMYRDSLRRDVEPLGCFDQSVLIYSMYHGYRKEPSFHGVEDFLENNGIGLEATHTSGHADRHDLERLVKAIAPKTLVPIHTFNYMDYYELWGDVTRLHDGATWPVP